VVTKAGLIVQFFFITSRVYFYLCQSTNLLREVDKKSLL